MKRFLRSPWVWIVVAVVGVLLALQYLAPSGGYDEVDTGQMNSYITAGQVKEITLVDGDQQIKATLDSGVRSDGDQVTSHWLDGTQPAAVEEHRGADQQGHPRAHRLHRQDLAPEPPGRAADDACCRSC